MKKQALNKQQNSLIKDFISTTSASEKQATSFLTRTKWNIQNAINLFFDQGAEPQFQKVESNNKIDTLFLSLSSNQVVLVASDKAKSSNVRYMDEDMFESFNTKYLHIADDNVVLGHILLNIMGVQTSGHIQKQHFVKLFNYLKVSDPDELYKKVPNLEKQLRDSRELYYSMYIKLYKFYILGSREISLNYDIAIQLWKFYLKPIMPLYSQFVAYLDQLTVKPHKIHNDLWKMVYEFATTIKDVNTVKQSDGWPVFLDGFVQFVKERSN